MCKTGPRATDPQPDDDRDRRRGSRSYGKPDKNPRPPGRLWFAVLTAVTFLVACGDGGAATSKDRDLMYNWDKPSAREKRKLLDEGGHSRREKRPGRGTRWGGMPKPPGQGDNERKNKPWGW